MRMTLGWALIANEDKTNTRASDENNFIIQQEGPREAELHTLAQREHVAMEERILFVKLISLCNKLRNDLPAELR